MKSARASFASMLHHDAITGTCTNQVEHDYLKIISDGRFACSGVIISSLRSLSKLTLGEHEDDRSSEEKVVALGGGGTGALMDGYAQVCLCFCCVNEAHAQSIMVSTSYVANRLLFMFVRYIFCFFAFFVQLGIGAILGRDGEIDLLIFNSMINRGSKSTRSVSIVVPCFVKSVAAGEEGEWLAFYDDDISTSVVTSQLLPIFVSGGGESGDR